MAAMDPTALAVLNLVSLLIGVILGYAIRTCSDALQERRRHR